MCRIELLIELLGIVNNCFNGPYVVDMGLVLEDAITTKFAEAPLTCAEEPNGFVMVLTIGRISSKSTVFAFGRASLCSYEGTESMLITIAASALTPSSLG